MRELRDDLVRWRRQELACVVARVVDVSGSGPRLPGAAMAVNELGEVIGSVSGGCVEGAVVTEALDVIATGTRRLVSFGYSDDEAFSVGLTCGGTVHLFLEPFDDLLLETVQAEPPFALATVVEGPGIGSKLLLTSENAPQGSLGNGDIDRVVTRDSVGELEAGRTSLRHYGTHGEARENVVSVFIESFATQPQMIIFGAVDFTASLVRVAKVLGYRVTVCDAREVFATTRRFPLADEVVVDWPQRLLDRVGGELGPRDAVCVLTHDHKFDVPAIAAALETHAGYIGVMGSRRTHDERVARLADVGIAGPGLDRVHSPIGLDVGARTPEETAIAICAEIIAIRNGRTAGSLRESHGPIH